MKTCKTCKHWNRDGQGPSANPIKIGVCTRAMMFWDATEWDADGQGRAFKDRDNHELFFVQDGSDYMADLLTMPDFGCNQHEDA